MDSLSEFQRVMADLYMAFGHLFHDWAHSCYDRAREIKRSGDMPLEVYNDD